MNPAILSSRKAINGVPVPPVIPQRDAPLRSEAHAAVLRADVPGLLEEAEAFGEDDEDGQGPHGDKHENEHHKTGRTGKASPARTLARVRCVPPAPPRHSRSANSAHRAWAPSAHRCHPVLRSRADVHERLCDARSSRRRHLPSRVTSAGGRAVRRRTTSISVSSRACPWYAQMRGLEHPGAPLRRYDAVGMGISGALRMRWDAETPRSPSYTTLRSKRRSRCEQKQAMTTSGGAIDGGVQMRWDAAGNGVPLQLQVGVGGQPFGAAPAYCPFVMVDPTSLVCSSPTAQACRHSLSPIPRLSVSGSHPLRHGPSVSFSLARSLPRPRRGPDSCSSPFPDYTHYSYRIIPIHRPSSARHAL
ncbi:hypothetical protein C8J57DRAFT_554182 [Mycena rebaudengoi]|nr:hypothetical protein C8J57DRAFT_554182 [Mycena rebaudengoi]